MIVFILQKELDCNTAYLFIIQLGLVLIVYGVFIFKIRVKTCYMDSETVAFIIFIAPTDTYKAGAYSDMAYPLCSCNDEYGLFILKVTVAKKNNVHVQ